MLTIEIQKHNNTFAIVVSDVIVKTTTEYTEIEIELITLCEKHNWDLVLDVEIIRKF